MNKFSGSILALLVLGFPSSTSWAEEPLTWADCLREAQAHHPDLISAEANVDEQKAGKAVTASGLLPQISADVNAATAKTQAGDSGRTDSYSYGVTGTQLLFDGFKKVNDRNAATENVKASQERYRFTSADVRARLRTAFINLLKAQESVKVAEEIVEIRTGNFDLINLRHASGLEHRGALLTVEADLAKAQLGRSQARRDIELAQRQLTKEMGRKEFVPMAVQGDLAVKNPPREQPDFEALAKNNPSLLQLAAAENSAAFSVKSAYANFSPQVSAQAGAGRRNEDWPPQDNEWDAGVSVSLPLFEGGLKTAQVAQAKAALRQAQADTQSTRDSVLVALEQNWLNFQNAIDNVEVQAKVLKAAEERSRIAAAQYSTGFITYDNWSIIEDNLVSAKNAYLDAQANALTAQADWEQAKGETLDEAQ